MKPDDPSLRPCASYRERRMHRVSHGKGRDCWKSVDGRLIGFKAVGEGWHQILTDLDSDFSRIMGPRDHTKITILQIKEKFGGLRVYPDFTGDVGPKTRQTIYGVICDAEERSYTVCEACGSVEGVETRGRLSAQAHEFGRTLTLCGKCHQKRDESDTFSFGGFTV